METIYLVLTRDDLTNATEINILIIKALILIMNTCTKYDCYHFNNYFTKHHNLSLFYYDETSVSIHFVTITKYTEILKT